MNCGVSAEASDISAVKGKRSQRQSATPANGQGNSHGAACAVSDVGDQTLLTARAEVTRLGGCPGDCDKQAKKDVRTSDEHRK